MNFSDTPCHQNSPYGVFYSCRRVARLRGPQISAACESSLQDDVNMMNQLLDENDGRLLWGCRRYQKLGSA